MKSDDCAQQAVEIFQLAAITNAKKPAIDTSHNKFCLNCKQPLKEPRAYCDEDCREDHEWREQRLLHRPR